MIKAGKEQFVLRMHKVSLQRYLNEYAVLRLETENHCYPGDADRKRINVLAGHLFLKDAADGPDAMELKLKVNGQAYSLNALRYEGNEEELWLNGLLKLGIKKKESKQALVLKALTEKMYCVETDDSETEESIIKEALLRDGIIREIEMKLADSAAPQKKNPFGCLTKQQRKQKNGHVTKE